MKLELFDTLSKNGYVELNPKDNVGMITRCFSKCFDDGVSIMMKFDSFTEMFEATFEYFDKSTEHFETPYQNILDNIDNFIQQIEDRAILGVERLMKGHIESDIELDKAQELRCTKEYMSNDFRSIFKKGVVYKYNGAYCIIDENGCNRPLSADDIRSHFERVVDGQKFKVGDKIISVYGFKGTVIGFDENEKQYHYKDDNGIEHLLHIDNQKHWDLQETSDVELDRAAKLFMLQNGSIIHNLHREDAINSFIKDAFKAGSKWKEEKLMENAVEGSITNACNINGYNVAAFRYDEDHTYTVLIKPELGAKYGDKIKLIVLK